MKSIEEAGRRFQTELLHHFHCDRSDLTTAHSTTRDDSTHAKSTNPAGEDFLDELLRRFHNDRSYLVFDQPGEAAA
ncbi:MAG: hypothetical protein P0120_02715 [Nitrospira sp.]|nr:hypothetical protein [Nitrospira sp.]